LDSFSVNNAAAKYERDVAMDTRSRGTVLAIAGTVIVCIATALGLTVPYALLALPIAGAATFTLGIFAARRRTSISWIPIALGVLAIVLSTPGAFYFFLLGGFHA